MNDVERATGLIHAVAGAQSGGAALVAVADAFEAVRLEERCATVAYLRRWADLTRPRSIASDGIDEAADAIERGEHGS